MTIAREARAAILEHARESGDIECCGLLLGTPSHILKVVRAANQLASPVAFLLDPADHFAARRLARELGVEVVGFYHSHPRSAPYPSPRDIAEASYDSAVHVIAGVEGGVVSVRAFTIVNAVVTELTLESVPA